MTADRDLPTLLPVRPAGLSEDRLREAIAAAASRLAAAGVPSPRHDAEALAAHLLGVGRGELPTHPEPNPSFAGSYGAMITRRAGREPLQHITGEAHFRHVCLLVGPGVFVPRPETELTAGAAIDAARAVQATGRAPVVVDLYAGSGAIALAIVDEVAGEMPGAIVHAVEAEDAAVTWLRRNADRWSARGLAGSSLTVHHADVDGCADHQCAGDGQGVLRSLAGQVDVVVANPPYVPLGARIRDPEVAVHDPAAALWSGEDGLDAMRVLERTAARLARPGATLIAEHADVQGVSAPAVFEASESWTRVADHADLTGRPRYLTATRTGPLDFGL